MAEQGELIEVPTSSRRPPGSSRGARPSRWARRLVPVVLAVAALAGCSSAPSQRAAAADSQDGGPVEIGLPFPANLKGLAAILGGQFGSAGGEPPSDDQVKAFYQGVVDHINATGGLLGRQIEPVYYGLDATKSSGIAAEQAMCTQFTQDHHVFAVMALQNHSDSFVTCLQDANVITFDPPGPISQDDTFFTQNPLYATAGSMSLSRVAAVEANGLFEAGFFGDGAKVGLVGYDTPSHTRAITEVLQPSLAAHGITVLDQQLIKPTGSVGDASAAQQTINSAILRFKEEGIDHVLFFDSLGGSLSPWTKGAAAQGYHPKLGFTTNQLPAQRAFAGNERNPDQVAQFSTAMAVGWMPVSDVVTPQANATGAECTSILQNAGASAAQATQFVSICDQLLIFAAGVNTGGELTPRSALDGLGKATSLPSASLLGPPSYAGGRRDGAVVAKILAYTPDCQCFQYTGAAPLAATAFSKPGA